MTINALGCCVCIWATVDDITGHRCITIDEISSLTQHQGSPQKVLVYWRTVSRGDGRTLVIVSWGGQTDGGKLVTVSGGDTFFVRRLRQPTTTDCKAANIENQYSGAAPLFPRLGRTLQHKFKN